MGHACKQLCAESKCRSTIAHVSPRTTTPAGFRRGWEGEETNPRWSVGQHLQERRVLFPVSVSLATSDQLDFNPIQRLRVGRQLCHLLCCNCGDAEAWKVPIGCPPRPPAESPSETPKIVTCNITDIALHELVSLSAVVHPAATAHHRTDVYTFTRPTLLFVRTGPTHPGHEPQGHQHYCE